MWCSSEDHAPHDLFYTGLQEVGSYRPAVRPERRRAMQREIVASAPHALQVLASCLNLKGEQQPRGPLPLVTHNHAGPICTWHKHSVTPMQSRLPTRDLPNEQPR